MSRDKKDIQSDIRNTWSILRGFEQELREVEVNEMLSRFPVFDNSWSDDIKAKWFDDFRALTRL